MKERGFKPPLDSPRRKSFLQERTAVESLLDCFSLRSGFRNFFAEKIALPEFFTPAGRSVIIVLCSQKVRLLPYLLPLSYGIPSAFGARERFDVKASTISEMMYGIML